MNPLFRVFLPVGPSAGASAIIMLASPVYKPSLHEGIFVKII